MEEEWKRLRRPLTILDMGCGQGIFRDYVGDTVPAHWIGLDWRADPAELPTGGYDQLAACNFDKPLPVADQSVDAVIFLHVVEHLPRPEFTLSEIARVLKPDGVLVAGSPIAPSWIARLRERHFRRQLRIGRRRPGKHVNALSPARWRKLLQSAGLHPEVLVGGYLLRSAGNPLENTRAWARLNQVWGALFPSLGGEVCVRARAVAAEAPACQPVTAPIQVSWPTLWRPRRPAVALAGAALLATGLWLAWTESTVPPVDRLLRRHHDADDRFYVLSHPSLKQARGIHALPIVPSWQDIPQALAGERKRFDVHLLVVEEHLSIVADLYKDLRIVGRSSLNGTRIYLLDLLGREGYGKPPPADRAGRDLAPLAGLRNPNRSARPSHPMFPPQGRGLA